MVRRSKSDAENRLERDLYFGAGAGDPASCFGQRTDGGGGSYGLRQDHGGQLVFEPAQAGDTPCYLFLDDFHLLKDEKTAKFLCGLANRLPANIHLIVASRNNFLPKEEILRLGHRLHRIGREQLRLNHTELAHYAHRCGMDLTEAQVESLLRSCEGWFSAIYLNLHSLAERGILLSEDADIYSMFTAAMLENLPSQKREFLAVMGLADEFTVEKEEKRACLYSVRLLESVIPIQA